MRQEPRSTVMRDLEAPLEALLEALVVCDEVHLVIKNAAATAELRGRATLRRSAEWLTIQLEESPSHAHVRRGAFQRAEFLTDSGKNRGVRFLGANAGAALTCLLPGTAEAREGFSASRLEAFARLERAHRGAAWRVDS